MLLQSVPRLIQRQYKLFEGWFGNVRHLSIFSLNIFFLQLSCFKNCGFWVLRILSTAVFEYCGFWDCVFWVLRFLSTADPEYGPKSCQGLGEAEKPILHFLWKILSQFAAYNIQNYSKLTLPQTLRHYAQASTVILLLKKLKKLSLKEVILSMGLSAPPPWYDFFLT